MKPDNILHLDKIKVYFPFFKGKNGKVHSLRTEGEWIVSYLILCDTVVIPPRAFFLKQNLEENCQISSNKRLLKHLFETGQIITTSTKSSIRDLRDLVEYYHPKWSMPKLDFDLFVYDRDEAYQRHIYAKYLKEHISTVQYYGDSEKIELTDFLNKWPNHTTVLEKLVSLTSDMESPVLERLNFEALNAYFLAGAEGNAAIMPPSRDKERSLIYNPFYSKTSLQHFKSRIEKTISRDILSCPPKLFDNIKINLLPFRYKYFQISKQYQDNYAKIVRLLKQNKVYVDMPLVAIYAAAATTIASIFSLIITKDIFLTIGAVLVAKFLWKSILKVLKITDTLSKAIVSLLEHLGVFAPYRSEVSVLLEEFENSVKLIMTR